ncbi:uncharacterized protein LOC134226681 [Armigeres subalbatus]|uniref:uncharacterized protein LOC134226681 n=1 Tax=Armigeres subalbatus TaxID=124917 RepID=UPI002ED38A75
MKATFQLFALACFIIGPITGFASLDGNDDSDIINPNWVKPGWKDHHKPKPPKEPIREECKCPVVAECPKDAQPVKATGQEDRNALVFYRKFVRRVFDEDKLIADPEDDSLKLRNIQFKISQSQINKLQEARTAKEIDAVVTEIVEQSEGSVYYEMAEKICWSILSLYNKAVQNTIILYLVSPVIVILLMLSVAKVFHIRLWILIPLLAILITYVITYRDCNNRLELESLAKLMGIGYDADTCRQHTTSNFLGWIFQKDTKAECMEHLRQTYRLKRDFCDPSEVFIEMVAKLQLTYFETIVHKLLSIFKTSTSSSGFVESIFICIFILLMVYLILTVGIKYGLYASGNFMATVITSDRKAPVMNPIDAVEQQPSLPQAPITININVTKPKRDNSRIEPISNRIEEISDSVEPLAIAEDGSGDGPAVQLDKTSNDNLNVVTNNHSTDDFNHQVSDIINEIAPEPNITSNR